MSKGGCYNCWRKIAFEREAVKEETRLHDRERFATWMVETMCISKEAYKRVDSIIGDSN